MASGRRVPLGRVYLAKNTVALADPQLFVAGWEKTDRSPGRGFFCGVELVVAVRRPGEELQREPLT